MSKTMKAVKEKAGSFLAAAPLGEIPQSFLAALTANESYPPGSINSQRFEPAVLAKLVEVVLGQRKSYNGVTAGMLYLGRHQSYTESLYFNHFLKHLQDAATSWGFTQIMGYHMLRWDEKISDLIDPAKHYKFTIRLLVEIVDEWKLNPGVDFEEMARCWNTGKPDGKTYHKSYVPNILRRMTEWAQMGGA